MGPLSVELCHQLDREDDLTSIGCVEAPFFTTILFVIYKPHPLSRLGLCFFVLCVFLATSGVQVKGVVVSGSGGGISGEFVHLVYTRSLEKDV